MRNMRNLLTRNQNFTIFAQNLWNLGLFTRILMELLGLISRNLIYVNTEKIVKIFYTKSDIFQD